VDFALEDDIEDLIITLFFIRERGMR